MKIGGVHNSPPVFPFNYEIHVVFAALGAYAQHAAQHLITGGVVFLIGNVLALGQGLNQMVPFLFGHPGMQNGFCKECLALGVGSCLSN
ncbi:hypothetical protein D3C74_366050 [compost metagenome]